MINFVGRALERRHQRALEALQAGADFKGSTPEDILRAAQSDAARIELVAQALAAASTATTDAKVRALGRALASGALSSDEALVDQEVHVISALARLEPAHVRALELLSETRIPQVNGVLYRSRDLAWPVLAIAQKYPSAAAVLPALLATLSSVGAIRDVAVGTLDYAPTYEATDFGRLCLERLRQAARA
jgi:hypothetical protein